MHKSFTCLLILGAGLWACRDAAPIERPRDPWVFRSVLDERPRMITMALHDNMWAAYDVQKCGVYKVWKGGVNFDGAVYTTKHGPQPNTLGYSYLEDPLQEHQWSLFNNDNQQEMTLHYRGHRFEEEQIILQYEIERGEQRISILETPEYIENDGNPGLSRTFKVDGLEEDQYLTLGVNLGSISGRFDFESSSELEITSAEEITYGGETSFATSGQMKLNNGTSTLETYYKAIRVAPTKPSAEQESDNLAANGAELIENSDCKTCHNPTERTVGPSYQEIAERYNNSPGNVRELSAKIIEGGSGNWGEVPMTAHPDLEAADAGSMVRYILSLSADEAASQEADQLLGQTSIAMDLREDNPERNSSSGLATNVYVYDDPSIGIQDLIASSTPVLSGVAPAIHIAERADLGKFNTNVLFEFKGQITVSEATNVNFRLVSDDGSHLFINGREIIDNGGYHGVEARDGEVILNPGANDIMVLYYQGLADGVISLQWAPHGASEYQVVPQEILSHDPAQLKQVVPYVPRDQLVRSIPGDQQKLAGVHPSFDLSQARPSDFKGRIGGMDFLSDGRLVVCTWDSLGPVYVLDGVTGNDPEAIKVSRIATGLAEPLGLKVVDDEIYVLQKQELTHLIDHDGDEMIDEYRTLSDDWKVSANFHEFAFGLEYQDGYFYAALATAINPGGASTQPQIIDRGKIVKISREDGSLEFMAHGLRTPNGIGEGVDDQLFIADNQGDWLPSSKIVHVQQDAFYGSRSVDFSGTEGLTETFPVVWLPQDEIGNSPSQPIKINVGPYQDQMIHGEVTHGGIKRVFVEQVNDQYQGAVFRFTQGLEAGVNRLKWGPDGALYVGGVGSSGNWSDGSEWYGLQKLTYNDQTTFEMLKVMARTDGFLIEFTEPIEEGSGESAEEYQVQQWYYQPTENYGGPKLALETLEIASISLSDDRKQVFLELPGIRSGHVVYIRLLRPFRSAAQNSLWSTEAWYTLNQIPADNPGIKDPVDPTPPNILTAEEVAQGWKLLFDGQTTKGWKGYNSENPGSAWKIQDGALMLDNRNKQEGRIIGGGDIMTEEEYQDFEFTLEWKIESGGNSGIIYYVVEDEQYDYTWQTGLEMQVLDNVRHPDGRIETHRAGDLYDLISSKFVAANGPDTWNKIRIVSKGGEVSHWMNGYEVVTFEMHNQVWNEMIAKSKFKDMPDFGQARSGHIALQDHGDRVWFRNIKIKPL